MRVLTNVKDIPSDLKGAVIALGNFDGVHRGHLAVLLHGQKLAKQINSPIGVLTFDPHPRFFLKPEAGLFTLTPLQRKLTLLEATTIDFVNVLKFDTNLAEMSAEEFVDRIIVKAWQAKHVIVGYNFFFGKGRSGNPDLLQQLGDRHDFGVTVIAPSSDNGEVFSSSLVRALLRSGKVRDAANILGHWWTISGVVEQGAGRGRVMNYPTVNITMDPSQNLHHGIYAARIWIDGCRFDGAAYNGRRPTFDNGPTKLEAFLFDFKKQLYGHKIDIELIDFIREDEAFTGSEELVVQMQKDCAKARHILAAINSADPMLSFPIGNAIGKKITTARV